MHRFLLSPNALTSGPGAPAAPGGHEKCEARKGLGASQELRHSPWSPHGPFSALTWFPSCCSPPGTSTKHILDDISTMFDALADQLDAMLD